MEENIARKIIVSITLQKWKILQNNGIRHNKKRYNLLMKKSCCSNPKQITIHFPVVTFYINENARQKKILCKSNKDSPDAATSSTKGGL
jgi:hypothetical protein